MILFERLLYSCYFIRTAFSSYAERLPVRKTIDADRVWLQYWIEHETILFLADNYYSSFGLCSL